MVGDPLIVRCDEESAQLWALNRLFKGPLQNSFPLGFIEELAWKSGTLKTGRDDTRNRHVKKVYLPGLNFSRTSCNIRGDEPARKEETRIQTRHSRPFAGSQCRLLCPCGREEGERGAVKTIF